MPWRVWHSTTAAWPSTRSGPGDGFTKSGPANEWHLTDGRGRIAGHTGQQSFYFGTGETETGGGFYQNNADGTLSTPTIDLRGQQITGRVFLDLNHSLVTESTYDYASISVVDAEGNVTTSVQQFDVDQRFSTAVAGVDSLRRSRDSR